MFPFKYMRSPPDLWRTAVITLPEELEHRKYLWSGWRTEAVNLGSLISMQTLACGSGVATYQGLQTTSQAACCTAHIDLHDGHIVAMLKLTKVENRRQAPHVQRHASHASTVP